MVADGGRDVHVNLRSPTMGETSGTAIRALSLGKPLVVSDVGWFSELPGDVALKVPVDDARGRRRSRRRSSCSRRARTCAPRWARAARELARREHDLERVADLYVSAFEQAAGGARRRDAVLREVSEAAAEVGIAPGSAEAREIARRLAEVDLGA